LKLCCDWRRHEEPVTFTVYDFYLWVLHPVAHLSNWFLVMPSIATKFSIRQLAFIFLLSHYMFRPLRAILRWVIQLDVSMDCPLMQRIRWTCATRCGDVTCCTSAPRLCIPNTCYHIETNKILNVFTILCLQLLFVSMW
jgi:hypothetical protein